MSDPHRKHAFHHAVRCLAHPLSLLGMAVLFLNDYYLRIVHPSWFTGKLGDFAWLFFFPFFLTALLVWVLPKAWLKGSTPIQIGSGITALIFTLGNTISPFLQAMIDVLEWVIPWQFTGVTDPTDLIALPVMGLTVLLWGKLLVSRTAQLPQWRWLWLGIALLLTMGNSALPPTGIMCLDVVDNEVFVGEGWATYRAINGGMEWESLSFNEIEQLQIDDCDPWYWPESIQSITDPNDNNVEYRFNTDESIERSEDGGKTWVKEFDIQPLSQASQDYYNRMINNGSGFHGRVPVDAGIDPVTGNLLMAMRFQGVLIRTPEGDYHWVQVGNNFRYEMELAGIISLLIPGDAAIAIFLVIITVGTFAWDKMKTGMKVFLAITGIYPIALGFILQPARNMISYASPLITFSIIIGGILSFILAKKTFSHIEPISPVFITAAVVPVLFLVPMILWGYNIIPWYPLAFGIGVALSIGWTVFRHLQAAKLKEYAEGALAETSLE